MNRSVMLKALVLIPVLCFSLAFARGNAVASYVFGGDELRGELAEELAEAVERQLTGSGKYSTPRRGSRMFFREVEKEEARLGRRGQMLDDRTFCKIGGDFGVQYLAIIDIAKAGRGASVWARIIDLDRCVIVATAEYTSIIRDAAGVRVAATALSNELLRRQVGRRSISVNIGGGGVAVSAPSIPAPPPPPPARVRGDQIAAYVFGGEDMRGDLAEDLADAIVTGLGNSRKYSLPRRGARQFFKEADKMQARSRGKLLSDRDFCKIGDDFEIDYLVIIDIEKAGRGNSVWARILDLSNCTIVATGESTAIVRDAAGVRVVANEITAELLHRKIHTRGYRR